VPAFVSGAPVAAPVTDEVGTAAVGRAERPVSAKLAALDGAEAGAGVAALSIRQVRLAAMQLFPHGIPFLQFGAAQALGTIVGMASTSDRTAAVEYLECLIAPSRSCKPVLRASKRIAIVTEIDVSNHAVTRSDTAPIQCRLIITIHLSS
jgi:hypothetical protein